jgi:Zn-dependent peptidase ImmA (M78 family)
LLKKIDGVFGKGLNYYLDPKQVRIAKEESIFFRKDKFNADLNLSAKKIVNHFEEEKISLSALSKLSYLKHERLLPFFTVRNNPKGVAVEIRKKLYPEFNNKKREFLKSLISKFAEQNILVFEFVETWNKTEKVNINGFYLKPETIVLKRNQKSFSREIFTLIHELGHYLLNEEEIDERIHEDSPDYSSLSKIERWCNDFAYYFLVGESDKTLATLATATKSNDHHHEILDSIARETNLSVFALYTRLLINEKISLNNYRKVAADISDNIKAREAEEQQKHELERLKALEEGRKPGGGAAKPFLSPLYVSTIQSAFYEGVINEAEFCKRLNIKPGRIDNYLK